MINIPELQDKLDYYVKEHPIMPDDIKGIFLQCQTAINNLYSLKEYRHAVAKKLHFPQCWDIAAYPTLESAMIEYINFHEFECSCDECPDKKDK